MRALAAVTLLALAVVATGCAAEPSESPDPATALSASLVQLRSDVADRQAEIRLVNSGDDTIEVGAVSLSDDRLDGPATRVVERTSTLRAGGTVDIRVQLPAMACDAASAGRVPLATVSFTVGGAEASGMLAAPDDLGFLDRLHEDECRAVRLAEAADVRIAAFSPSPTGEPAILQLAVAPTGRGGASIDGIVSTNLLSFASTSDRVLPLDLMLAEEDTAPIVVDVPLVPARCDAHVVQEDKRGTVFTLQVTIDGGSGDVSLAAPAEMRGAILSWVGAWCGL